MLQRVLLGVDEAKLEKRLLGLLAQADLIVQRLPRKGILWERVGREPCDLVLIARSLLPRPAADSVRALRQLPDAPAVVVLSATEEPQDRAELLAAGCEAVLNPRLSDEMLWAVLSTILDKRRAVAEERLSRGRPLARPRLTDFVSASPAMRAFMNVVRRVVPTDSSLLILGETGAGKERLARAIHAEGLRGHEPFVTVNCGALPETLLESELFGHEEGSFTGATRTRRGLFELAHRGTVFLDEIGETPHHLQVKLLRALQEHEIQRIGGEGPITIDVRVIAATNRDLPGDVEAGRFRMDLYYRLTVVTLTLPPLRERREDIPALVQSYLDYFAPRLGRMGVAVSDSALEALCRYAWPGNVRELINVIERAVLLCSGTEISLGDLTESISGLSAMACGELPGVLAGAAPFPRAWVERPLRDVRREAMAHVERAYLACLLTETGGRVAETARRAGIDPRSLYGKMRRYGLRKEEFRTPTPPSRPS